MGNNGIGKGRGGGEPEQGNSKAWMVTFSDLSTLLLTFFVLLLSMSSLDDLKLKSLFHNFTSSCGILLFKEYGEIYRPKERLIEGLNEKLKDALVVRKDEEMEEKDIPSDITTNPFPDASGSMVFQNIEGGFKLVFGHGILFSSGSAALREEARPLMANIARFIRVSGYQLYIDGHTDSVPIRTEVFPSNEALSLARAYTIVEYLTKEEGLSLQLLAMAGYGETRPVTTNGTEEGRAKNRRVEMIFKNQRYF